MKGIVAALASGTIFGAGLAVSEMTNPAKVLGFLDVAGDWDPSLALVMGAALIVSALAYRLHRVPRPPMTRGIDFRLLAGASLFGLGWGVAGFCPGPAVAALVTGSVEVATFVGSMICGMALYRVVGERLPTAMGPT